jgi:hypothetical protein
VKKKWKIPKWMYAYSKFVDLSRAEEFMNCDGRDCNVFTNGPRALICLETTGKIQLLESLYSHGNLVMP